MSKSWISGSTLLSTILIASIYTILTIYLMNGELVISTIIGDFPFGYKTKLLFALLEGMWTAMSGIGLLTLFVTAILTGFNLSLFVQKLSILRNSSLSLVIGGSSIIGLVSSGCAACGLPLLALLGFGGSVLFLPFKGFELPYISVALLLASSYFLIKSNTNSCKINLKR